MTVDFVPLVCAVIALGVAVASFLGASLNVSALKVVDTLDDIMVESPGDADEAEPPSVPAALPKIKETPQAPGGSQPQTGSGSNPTVVQHGDPIDPGTGSGGGSGGASTIGMIGIVSGGAGAAGGSSGSSGQGGATDFSVGDGPVFGTEADKGEDGDSDGDGGGQGVTKDTTRNGGTTPEGVFGGSTGSPIAG